MVAPEVRVSVLDLGASTTEELDCFIGWLTAHRFSATLPQLTPRALRCCVPAAPTTGARLVSAQCSTGAVVLLVQPTSKPGVWKSSVPADPVQTFGFVPVSLARVVLKAVAVALDAEVLYFGGVYAGSPSEAFLGAAPFVARWSRSSSPFIDWSRRGADVWGRVEERDRFNPNRKRRRFQRVAVVERVHGGRAIDAITRVEKRSWKHFAGTDLLSLPGQLALYQGLVTSGLVEVSVAFYDGTAPIGYRMEARHGDIVYGLELSFDADYARFSPGWYLVAVHLAERWHDTRLSHFDLFGGPNPLKALVQSGQRRRYDFASPAGHAADQLRAERAAREVRRGAAPAAVL